MLKPERHFCAIVSLRRHPIRQEAVYRLFLVLLSLATNWKALLMYFLILTKFGLFGGECFILFLFSNIMTFCFAVPAQVTGLTVASQGSTNSLFTNWTKALGDVDSYQVLLIHENVVIKNETVPSETNEYHFYSLKPGGLYSVVVTTVSGGISSRQTIAEGRTGKKEIHQQVFLNSLKANLLKRMVFQLSHWTAASEIHGFQYMLTVCTVRHVVDPDSGYITLWSYLLCLQ